MNVLYASAEVDPFAKVGGLADVAAALPRKLRELGHDVRVITPCHATSGEAFAASTRRFDLVVAHPRGACEVIVAEVEGTGGVPVMLVSDREFFGREAVYGEPDDLDRYQSFSRTIAAVLKGSDWRPDILHLNDWHTAPLAFAMRNIAWEDEEMRRIATVFTIHNLRYRGPDEYNDFLAQAIYYSDAITTVSPAYAAEILTPEYGEGLERLLAMRRDDLAGILNGIDTDNYNPESDPHIAINFSVDSLEWREANRQALREETGLRADIPIAAMVTRLTEQKGVDLVIEAIPGIVDAGAGVLVLGNGDHALEGALRGFEESFPGQVCLAARFDEPFARRVYAGSDMLLMPSRYEPCGLGQMIAMRYGCVPIGRRTGGLADTIIDPDDGRTEPTGFLFDDYSPDSLLHAVRRARGAYADAGAWRELQLAGMRRDASWDGPAREYVDFYHRILRNRGRDIA